MTRTRLHLALPALALLSASASADEIHLIDGTSIRGATVSRESYKEIEYREDTRRKTVPAEQVLRIEYSAMPQLVDRAEASVKDDGILDAVTDLETYLDGILSGGRRERHEWAPAYAAWRLVELHLMLGELDKAIAAVNRLTERFPESMHVPPAYILKARIQADQGQAARAQQTLKDFDNLIKTGGLAARWALESDLAKVLCNPDLKGSARREALAAVAAKAGRTHPTVRNAADVTIAESYLEANNLAEAERTFQRIVDDSKAGRRTLAAAYTGLGDCLYQRAVKLDRENPEAARLFKQALMSFMRVVVVYGDQSAYVPKAMFYAARVFDLSDDGQSKENAQKLYRSLIRTYDGTPWATEARGFRRR